mgnify:CR=1 FL=1
MAVDTKQKRFSAISVSLPLRNAPIDPTVASFGAGDRAAAAYSYAGIAAGEPAAPAGIYSISFPAGAKLTFTLDRPLTVTREGMLHF